MRVVTISFTALDAPGGVPRFNRDIHSAFPGAVHYCWADVLPSVGGRDDHSVPEWDKAQVLNQWLLWTRRVTPEDVIIADSFWAAGLEKLPYCISHQHGNWGHVTLTDRQRGMKPEFPYHEKAQTDFRRRYLDAGRKLTTVSQFIQNQMKLQWGFESKVINNGIDTQIFRPAKELIERNRPIIIHFCTTSNKGFDHIDAVKREVGADVWLLDEAAEKLKLPKYEALAQADLVVHPSAHEGNSYAMLETLACGVPLVCYDVGLMYQARLEQGGYHAGEFGFIINRDGRHPDSTVQVVKNQLESIRLGVNKRYVARHFAERFDIENFRKEWKEHVDAVVQGR